VSNQPLAD
jgi:hypothetical protein